MSRLLARTRSEAGQAVVLVAVAMVALVGMAALVIDGGSWYQAQRHLQTSADAAALAGAQYLPENESAACASAQDYATRNDAGAAALTCLPAPESCSNCVTFPSTSVIDVQATAPAPGFFSKLFGIDSVTVHATASARAVLPEEVFGAAPIAINEQQTYLSGLGCPCFGPNYTTTIPVDKNGAPGAFTIIDLGAFTADSSGACTGGTPGNDSPQTLAGWITSPGSAPTSARGCYDSDSGAKLNAQPVLSAMQQRIGSTMLFPVYDRITGNGSSAQYHVIAWAAFHVLDVTAHGGGSVTGYFTPVGWDGSPGVTAPPSDSDFGVHVITLIQ